MVGTPKMLEIYSWQVEDEDIQGVSHHPGSQCRKTYLSYHDEGHRSMSQSPEADHDNPFKI
jgi:hypothetical protein